MRRLIKLPSYNRIHTLIAVREEASGALKEEATDDDGGDDSSGEATAP